MHDPDRDASVDRLLRRAFRSDQASGSPPDCLDADTLAAWADGGLPARQRAAAETHAAGCARCQALLAAFARTEVVPAGTSGEVRPRTSIPRFLRWLAPLTAAAAVAVLWVAVRPDIAPPVPAGNVSRVEEQRHPRLAAPPMEPEVAPRRATPSTPEALSDNRLRREASRTLDQREKPEAPASHEPQSAIPAAPAPLAKSRDVQAVGESQLAQVPTLPPPTPVPAGAAAARPAAPPPVPEPRAEAVAETLTVGGRSGRLRDRTAAVIPIPSADPASRWRIVSGVVVQHSADAGASWEARSTGSVAPLTAGASPSATVCWIVGRAGTILLTTDGTTWQSVTFPEKVDLIAVTAIDARAAAVTTVDERTFETADGGGTWVRKE